ncbi:citrate transporter, putative [Entamoeba histolytica HM-1:IMSS-B]|uniref:Sodium/sulfate symporter, putative n=6 Tax=Entamoeba histolytica TaxID=5759 RepID=C4M0X1_ENTH1|nr:sodium/sulfate symporter, putative [Entamoeba histolytica HM-1:IMSS]EMD45845.1 sodium/sulfate transporter, putative [Entamoeba histolytica KU27]EMH75437.1 citrate transporter, putative [Entamoeba histolytica HM-1:IMSS-B]EMS17515.1 sodium/sulfate transporter, putative [Entamoeba histolytica HM-3:IMSS]ENY64861.1 sodium/sulfate transporter, putative [Entamoeba histolytica HM-1:IMSS-A]GAT94825.1 citrate transporter putative [Entamoeba histolytica]|eukprot:XP_654503.1 sodium/sulfate symporter, putative [Entamoeba histolytica HM-1:IMSS]
MDIRKSLKHLQPYKGTILFFVIFTILLHYLYFLDWYTHYETQLHNTTYLFLMIFDIMLTVLIADVINPGIVVFMTVTILMAFGVINLDEAFIGFSDSSTLTVMVALILSAGINKVQILDRIIYYLLPTTRQEYVFPSALRFLPFVMILSLFLNNTPVVAMSIPLIQSWAKTSGHSANRLLMSVSFCAILGGMNSILGTSTNMVGRGLVYQQIEKTNSLFNLNLHFEMPLFEIGIVAFPLAIAGYFYCSFCTSLLKKRKCESDLNDKCEDELFRIDVVITKSCPYIGTDLQKSPLHSPPNGRVIGVKKKDMYQELWSFNDKKSVSTIPESKNEEQLNTENTDTSTSEITFPENYLDGVELTTDVIIEENDVLTYEIPLKGITDILKQRGIIIENLQTRNLIENYDFNVYEVCIKKGETELKRKDWYGVLAFSGIEPINEINENRKFIIVVKKEILQSKEFLQPFLIAKPINIFIPRPLDIQKVIIALVALAFPIFMDVFELGNLIEYALMSVLLLLGTKVLTIEEVFKAIDIPLYCILGASFGLSTAMVKTNAGSLLALTLTRLFNPFGKLGMLAALYIPTLLLTQPLSNTAVVAVMFPVVWSAYWGKDPYGAERGKIIGLKSSMYTMMLAASEVFVLPIGYQTNMMVMIEGGYTVSDFVTFGTPLMLISLIISIGMPWLVFEVLYPTSL